MLHQIIYNGMSGYMLVDSKHNPFEEPFVPEPGPQPEDFSRDEKKQAVRKGFGLRVHSMFAGFFVSKPTKAVERCQGDF